MSVTVRKVIRQNNGHFVFASRKHCDYQQRLVERHYSTYRRTIPLHDKHGIRLDQPSADGTEKISLPRYCFAVEGLK